MEVIRLIVFLVVDYLLAVRQTHVGGMTPFIVIFIAISSTTPPSRFVISKTVLYFRIKTNK